MLRVNPASDDPNRVICAAKEELWKQKEYKLRFLYSCINTARETRHYREEKNTGNSLDTHKKNNTETKVWGIDQE